MRTEEVKVENLLARSARPFIKCPGGKAKLKDIIINNFPSNFEEGIKSYVEPFIGGGAITFDLLSKNTNKTVSINDLNGDIYNTYFQLKENYEEVISHLDRIIQAYASDDTAYYRIRDLFNKYKGSEKSQDAAYFIYLNKMCFNGLIRYNRNGGYNSPKGSSSRQNIYEADNLRAVNNALSRKNVKLFNLDFSNLIWQELYSDSCTPEETFFYLDPPYDSNSLATGFVGYTPQGFSKTDHLRLRKDLDEITRAKSKFLLSGSDTSFMREAFKQYNIIEISAGRCINSNAKGRGKITELLIKNY